MKTNFICLLLCIFLLTSCLYSCTYTENDIPTLYDPREEEGLLKDGFSHIATTGVIDAGSQIIFIAYKCPDMVDLSKEYFEIEIFYGYNAHHYDSIFSSVYSVTGFTLFCTSEDQHLILENAIPIDDAKAYYVLTEEKAVYDHPRIEGAKAHLQQLTFSHSKKYFIPTSLLVADNGMLHFSFSEIGYNGSLFGTDGRISVGYSKTDLSARMLTSSECTDEYGK